MSKVVVVTGHDRRQMVREALTRLGDEWTQRVQAARRIFIHPNFVNFRRPEANTHPEAVRGVLDHIIQIRGDEILIGDAGVRDTTKAFEALGYRSLERSGKIRLVDLNDDETVPSFAYRTDMTKREIGFSKTVAESDLNIVVVPAKMHSYFGVTLSIKTQVVGSFVVLANFFGTYMRWPWVLTGIKSGSHTLADVFAEYPAHLAIIDGTSAMEGNGPVDGRQKNLGWLIASFSPISADALAAYLMGWDPHEIGYLHFLSEKELGTTDIEAMEIEGREVRTLRQQLQKPDSYPDMLGWK